MEDVIQVHDQFYILATASRATQRTAVLKHDDTFALFDTVGDVGAFVAGEQGLYHEGTRYLSRFQLRMNGQRPLLLSARVKDDNELFGADLTNPDIPLGDGDRVLARDVVHLFRGRFLWDATWHERLRLWNYSRQPVRVSLTFDIDADFADIFEVRGMSRERRGTRSAPVVDGATLRLDYCGLDGERRSTVLEWSEVPAAATPGMARFEYELAPRTPTVLTLAIRCDRERRPAAVKALERAESEAAASLDRARGAYAMVESSSERFNHWLRRSAADLRMLVSTTPYGEYPYAGVPWFSTPFGRDGIVTAFQTLWINPRIARGVLEYLAATQADHVDPQQDAEPGKILHETRSSEMARLGEVPFGRYYGSVDATPLFVMLAGAYFDRTGDREFLIRLWPHVVRALAWIDDCGDRDGDGFVEYARHSPTGLVHQGWKDSQDSVFHADGSLAEPPIALCEVQAYVYDARLRAAELADTLGDGARATALRDSAERLRRAFEDRFWLDDLGTYALALDGRKTPCAVRSSNAGHCLFGGIASPERARRVAEQLVGPEMFSGWGIRTIASTEPRYNPMSYHNGSVWPHDNGIVAAGFSRYGLDDLIGAPFSGLFEASLSMDASRLPELFCGFHRRPGEGPTLYPVACSPQAWSSGVVFGLLQACLRLSIDVPARRLSVDRAILPAFLNSLRLENVDLTFGTVDLLVERHPLDVNVTVLKRSGDFEVRVVK
jgi:glycogen debranching enzyme